MPKMKTHSASKKRFKKTGNGNKVKRSRAYHRHLLTKKSAKVRQDLRKRGYVSACDVGQIAVLLPY